MNPDRIWENRQLLWQWTRRILALRHKGSALGWLWTLATPLFMLAIYTFVFGIVFQTRWQSLNPDIETTKGYAVILFCGMATYHLFSETVSTCCRCVIDNPNLVKKVIFPLGILPVAQTLAATVTSMAWLGLTLLALILSGMPMPVSASLFPLFLIPLMALSAGVGFFVAATTVYLRDTPHLASLILQGLFFMTPIFYPEALVPENLRFVLLLNPLAWLCGQARSILIFGQIPPWHELALTWIFCLLVFRAGHIWFMKVKKGFADVL